MVALALALELRGELLGGDLCARDVALVVVARRRAAQSKMASEAQSSLVELRPEVSL